MIRSLRIPGLLTMIVVTTGIIVFVRRLATGVPFPTTAFIIWLIVSIILIAISAWVWQRNRKKK